MTNDDNAPSFKYKANIAGYTGDNGRKNGVKIAAPLKYLSNFWRSLEIALINCKIELSLNWYGRCLRTFANTAAFKITDAICSNCYFISKRQCKIIKVIRPKI